MKNILIFTLLLQFLSCQQKVTVNDQLNLQTKLEGKWKASAFDGELRESWSLDTHGWMQQEGFYIEHNDTTYSAVTKIEKVGEEIILISVIKNSPPKIFQAIDQDDKTLLFENKDYKNPFQVKYEFLDPSNYRRTISGYEQDSLVVYEFNFKKY